MQTLYRDPASEWRSAREGHGQNDVMPGVRRYDLSWREHLPGAVLFSAAPLLRRPGLSRCLRSRFCTFSYSVMGECRVGPYQGLVAGCAALWADSDPNGTRSLKPRSECFGPF
jgi:hypothetical protein